MNVAVKSYRMIYSTLWNDAELSNSRVWKVAEAYAEAQRSGTLRSIFSKSRFLSRILSIFRLFFTFFSRFFLQSQSDDEGPLSQSLSVLVSKAQLSVSQELPTGKYTADKIPKKKNKILRSCELIFGTKNAEI